MFGSIAYTAFLTMSNFVDGLRFGLPEMTSLIKCLLLKKEVNATGTC